jgi:hypothetical protein
MATVLVDGIAVSVVFIIVAIGLIVLNVVALVKIVSKAGYSGAWVLVTFVPIVAWIATSAIVYSRYNSIANVDGYTTSFDAATFIWAWVVDAAAYLVPWIFFLILAFSDWPVLKEVRSLRTLSTSAVAQHLQAPPQFGQMPVPTPTPTPPPFRPPSESWDTGGPPAGTVAAQAHTCRNCGGPVITGAGFCGACGSRLGGRGPV